MAPVAQVEDSAQAPKHVLLEQEAGDDRSSYRGLSSPTSLIRTGFGRSPSSEVLLGPCLITALAMSRYMNYDPNWIAVDCDEPKPVEINELRVRDDRPRGRNEGAHLGTKWRCPTRGDTRVPIRGEIKVARQGANRGCPSRGQERLPVKGPIEVARQGAKRGCPSRGQERLPVKGPREVARQGANRGCPSRGQ
ncbi:hypothetical protein AAG570_000231 [Ranatra chinensis]|uniref:Uncharacterized protein n=1 Tax=Ranatra chinensis TaxID=642074 RepID=A0ABD0YYM0_9HEMI